jgi:hypothetical protein
MTQDLKAAQKKLRESQRTDMEKISSGVAIQGAKLGKEGKPIFNKEDI